MFETNTMPPMVMPSEETDEEKRRKLPALAGGMSATMPPAYVDPTSARDLAPQPSMAGPPMRMPAASPTPAQPPASPAAGHPPLPPINMSRAPIPNAELASGAMPAGRMPAMQPPAPPVNPDQKRYEDLVAQGEPKLPWWKRALDVAGSVFPIGREIESQIPGSPQNYHMQLNQAAVRAAKVQDLQQGAQKNVEGQQQIEKSASAAQFDTPEKRRQYVQQNPELFNGVTDFEKNDFILSGKTPQKEPTEKPQDVVKQYSDALAAGDDKKAAEMLPRVKQFIDNTQKPPKEAAPNEKDKDISDYLEANKLPDTAASREKARGAIAQRSKTEVNSTDAKDIATAIAHGDQPPTTTGLYRNAALVRAELARMGFNLAQAESDWHATQRHLATLNGAQQERLRQAVSFTGDSLGIIDDLYNQWQKVGKTSEWKTFNKASLAAAKQLPGEPGNVAHRLEAQINDLTSELGTVYKGGNSSTDESLKLAAGNLQGDWNEKTFKDALAQIRKNLEIRTNSIKHSQPAGVSANSPYTPQGEKGGGKAWNAATGKYE